MTNTTQKTKANEALLHQIEQNKTEVGKYLKGLLEKDLGEWENRVVALMARSKAYRSNDLPKMLELANDMKAAHQAQISFIEKYEGDLFISKPNKSLALEREELGFLEKEIIPFLLQKVK